MQNSKQSAWSLIHKQIFIPPAILLIIAILIGALYPEGMKSALNFTLGFITKQLGWLFTLGSVLLVVFCLWAGFSRVGKIRLGGPNAKPTMSRFQWFAVSFTASLATGIIYWGVAEPMTYFMSPPTHLGLEGGTIESANIALLYSYLHWSFVPFSIYASAGISVAFLFYNCGKPFRVSTALYPLIGERAYGPIGNFVEAIAIFGTIGGLSTSLGLSTMQMASGLNYLFAIDSGTFLLTVIIIVMACIYTFVATTGVHKGIKHVGTANMYLYFVLMIFVFSFGHTRTIVESIFTTVGEFLVSFIPLVTFSDPYAQTGWPEAWTTFYWAWWLASAPIAGLFLIKLAKGRTVHDFVIVNLIAPTLMVFLWFGLFGSAGIASDLFDGTQIGKTIMEIGSEFAIYELFKNYPVPLFSSSLALLVIATSYSTTAEAWSYTLAAMTTVGFDEQGNEKEPPKSVIAFWGFSIAAITIVLLYTGGKSSLQALQTSALIAGLPIIVIELFMALGYVKSMQNIRKYDIVGTIDDPLYRYIAREQDLEAALDAETQEVKASS